MKNLGRVLQRHAERVQAQHDVATAQTVIRDLRDRSRTEMDNHTAKEGAQAKGTIGSYLKWFDEEAGKIEQGLENFTQKQLFRTSKDSLRGRDLDTLSEHQAKQHKIHLLGNVRAQSMEGEAEVARSPKEQTIIEELDKLRTASRALYPGDTDEQLESRLVEDSKKLRVIALKNMVQNDPEQARMYVEAWREELGDMYAPTREAVYSEYLYQSASQKFPDDPNKQYDYVKNYEGVSERTKSFALGRINAFEAETEYRERKTYADLYGATQDQVWELARKGNYSQAMKLIDATVGLKPTEKASLESAISSSAKGADPFTVSDYNVVNKMIGEAQSGKLDPAFIVPIPNEISRQDATMLQGIANRVQTKINEPIDKLMTAAKGSVNKQVLKGNQLLGYTPESSENAYNAFVNLHMSIENEKDPNKKLRMLTPGSKDYIVDDVIRPYQKTFQQQMDEAVKRVEALDAEESQVDPDAVNVLKRIAGETIQEWRKRTKQ